MTTFLATAPLVGILLEVLRIENQILCWLQLKPSIFCKENHPHYLLYKPHWGGGSLFKYYWQNMGTPPRIGKIWVLPQWGLAPGWVLPYMGMVGDFVVLGIFNKIESYFIPQHNPIDIFFLQKKISLSLSHLVPEILGLKFGLIFHQNVLFNRS